MIERCVCCGAEIPEGRMICPACERAIIPDDCKECPHNIGGKNGHCALTGAPIGGRTHCGKDKKA